MPQVQVKMRLKKIKKSIIITTLIGLLVTLSLAPIIWELITSFKLNEDILKIPLVYFPNQITLDHYTQLFTTHPFWRYIINSAFVASTSTILSLIFGTPAAYALARLNPWGSKIIISSILIITLFPGILLLSGLLEIVRFLHLGNNYLSIIIPYSAINLPLTILVLRNFFKQLPKELEDAAKIDGYNTIQMLLRIILPITTPALITTGILSFIFAWNEFIFALTFITREEMKTIPIAVAQIGGTTEFEIPYGPIAAATMISTLPLMLIVLFFQNKIIQGLTSGAIKG
ncbi:MAG: carbohydrate ABC transporter permease [Cylindrospermopsis raciborskii KL1]|jgi:multiple sugar transport system permease protein|uniref:carbohydrate ABC transporter permease n=1 Tax=Cylindrospermopsis raciborskii TaxID=77022 RepID=UPI001A1C45C5|nr:carbohydrate ABC transporter permease [Cylindrospermopsis raciborskii]MBG0744711.1 carbohydrate ABC transporter permease [Cylindrospermopsis raciborskii KL1]